MESSNFQQEIAMAGYIQLKRKSMWVVRYAEIINGVFFYYKDKGDARPRGTFRLSDCNIGSEISSDGDNIIVITIKPKSQQSLVIQLMADNKTIHTTWLKHLTSSSVNQSRFSPKPGGSSGDSFIANQIQSALNFFDIDSDLESASNFNIPIKPTYFLEKNRNLSPLQRLNIDRNSVDEEFLKNKLSEEQIQGVKTMTDQFLSLFTENNEILGMVDQDIRVYCSQSKAIEEFYRQIESQSLSPKQPSQIRGLVSSINTTLQHVRKFFMDIQAFLGPLVFWEVVFIVSLTLVVLLQRVYSQINFYTLCISFIITVQLIFLPFTYTKEAGLKQNLNQSGISLLENGRPQMIRVSYFLPHSLNDFLFCVRQIKHRQNWQPCVFTVEQNNNGQITVSSAINNLESLNVQKFFQSVYKRKDNLVLIEHQEKRILRVFEVVSEEQINAENDDKSGGILINFYFWAFDSIMMSNLRNNSPLPNVLRGVNNFLKDQKRHPNSELLHYYIKLHQSQAELNKNAIKEKSQNSNSRFSEQPSSNLSNINQKKPENSISIEETKENQEPAGAGPEEEEEVIQDKNGRILDISRRGIAKENLKFFQLALKAQNQLFDRCQLSKENDWQFEEKTQSGVTVHTRVDPSTGNVCSRGEALIPLSIQTLTDFITDLPRRGQYDEMFDTGQIVTQFCDDLAIVWQKFKGKWPVGSRDFLMVSGVMKSKDQNRYYIIAKGVDQSDFQIKPSPKDATRGDLTIGGWILDKVTENSTQSVYMTLSDLKGSVPQSIKDWAAQKQGYSVENIIKLVEKGQIKQYPQKPQQKVEPPPPPKKQQQQEQSEQVQPSPHSPINKIIKPEDINEQEKKSFREEIFKDQNGNQLALSRQLIPDKKMKFFDLALIARKELQDRCQLLKNDWKLEEQTQSGVTVHTKVDPITGNVCSRGEALIPIPIQKLTDFITNLPRRGQYDEMFENGEIFDQFSENLALVWQKFQGKWPVGSRDFLMVSGVIKCQDVKRFYIIAQGVDEADFHLKPSPQDTTRGDLTIGGWILDQITQNSTQSVYMTLSDLKGKVPQSIKDWAAQQQGYSVENILKMAIQGQI